MGNLERERQLTEDGEEGDLVNLGQEDHDLRLGSGKVELG